MDREKYLLFKIYGVLSTNRTATIVPEKFESVTFSFYDKITINDFYCEDIFENKAKLILDQLVKTNILQIDNDKCYRLKVQQLNAVQLLNNEIYENAVDAILEKCFNYRCAFNSIVNQLKTKSPMIQIPLLINPHNNVMNELIRNNIIKPYRIKKRIDIESKIKDIFERPNTIPVFDYVCKQYQKLSGVEETDLAKTIKRILKKDSLSIDEFISSISYNLQYLSGSINVLEAPDSFFYSITEYIQKGDFSNYLEMYVFKLHCLDDLIRFNEKQYTWKMIIWTSAIFLFGVAQIIIGAFIESYSAGLFTHVAGALISEGFSDIMYAMGALHSGYFSLKQYANYKVCR